ncbi:probable WRKY transcription factor protein 1 isoform X5 [Culex quinquefasciatus]|uniref:probable WRKY transcription factor protein 1 isoform X5 n=1 Tax=Culex quinquefasciatus TaxID=7176 RepID=UPI0018E2C969|nr:probable WRKY transcription factor protein 1 isoform X5 [Culex quinquefasciatus]
MWNKLFKSKSKSSKNLSTSSSHSNGGGPSSSPPLDLVPIYNIDNRIRYGDDDFEPAADDVELRRNHNRDSIGPQMCGIPMRKSKFSSAFKSLSLRRGSTKNQLKLYPGEATPVDESPTSVEDIQISAKRASLRPSKSDNNLNEKQNYADQEKEDPVYEQQQQQYRPPDPFLEIPDPPEHLELQPCPICARNFVPTSLVKHIAICERMQSKKRKPFDSSRQRREGTELASYLPKNFGLPQNHPQARVSPPKTTNPVRKLSTSKTPTPERKDYSGAGSNNNSMSTSQTLATMSSSGGGGGGSNTHQTTATGATTPRPILKRSLSQQNEPCPYCERCFGFKAYDRHVEWCREKALLNKNIQHHQSSVAKERLQARIQYKAPQLKSKRALNREKYSGSLSCGGSTSSLADLDLPFPRHRSHLNSMSSSLSSDNKSDHSGSLKKIPSNDPGAVGYAGDRRGGTLPGKKREIRANLLENENFRNDSNNNNNPTGKIFGNNLLIRSTQDVRREKEQAVSVERVERLELVATGRAGEQRVPLKRGATKIVKCNKSGYTPDRYDPFLSAKRQLEELFSPTSSFNTSTKQQQTSNSRVTSPATPSPTQAMSKSVVVPATTKTTSPNMNLSNFRRASSLRMPRKVSRPMFIEKAKSNIQKGITDDGPVSPNFLKSSEYDEIPIKSVFNAAQMAEKPKMRDSSSVRRNLKLDIKDPNMPATDVPLSKTDSLAVFLKYEHELNLLMSEKEMKDKSNSLSKRSASLTGHERKETYSPSVNCKSNERSSPSEKEKPEKPVQEIQPIKKVPQKLVPIKLDPINITYNNNNSNSTSKPTVISLDAILGKSSTKPKAPPEEKLMTRKESTNYIDPKLINRCDNLPIMVTKLTKPELIETKPTVPATTIPKVSPEPPKRLNGTSPDTEGGGGKATDNRLSDLSTKSDDSKPTLTRQNGTSASRSSESSSIGDSSREPSPPSQRSEHKPNQDAKSQSPDSGVERSTPTKQPASTPIAVQKPERPPLPSFDDFDFEEFISSFEDERRSFQNAFYSRNATSNNNNSSTSSFNQRVTNNSFTDNSVKSAVNGSSTSNNNNNTSSPSHFAASKPLTSSQSYYKPLNINGRSEEEETRQKSPQVPPRRHQPAPPPEQPPSTIRNLPSIQPVVAKTLPGSPTPNNPNSIFPYGPPSNDTNNNNNNNSVKSSPSSTSRLGSGNNNSFNNSPLTATTHQPYQQQHQQHTTLSKTTSATNHMISATPSPPPPPQLANSAASTAFLDDLSPTERDLMKSVQELDRMCESSSSMYPADSDEVSSVEGYPLSGGGSRDGGQRGHRPSEGSKFSADSAYGSSLSRQSPNQQDSHHTHTVRRTHHHHHHHRGGATSQQQQLLLQQDAFDNSSGSESSLPPITTATLKAQKIELHSHGSSTKLAAGPTATAAAAAMAASQMSKFCHECGSRFMISTAKFCMECGVRRIMLD